MRRHRSGRATEADSSAVSRAASPAPLPRQCPLDLVERAPGFLHRLDLQELLEVRRAVVAAAAEPEGSGQQAFLDLVPHRASRNTAQIGEVANAVKDRVAHGHEYRQLLSHCQLSLFYQGSGVRR